MSLFYESLYSCRKMLRLYIYNIFNERETHTHRERDGESVRERQVDRQTDREKEK